jgi:hypothetical protein
MVKHSMSFKGIKIQVNQDICDPESIISYDKTLLDDEETVWVVSLITTKAPNPNELKNMVQEEYHEFMTLFGEPLV